ncbi:MAG TPA: hypothetical protein VHN11_09260 [Xanthobacteraceae bacterium]|jgi:hypothetical protein|nr:hypothetical protein [Xanthobacteraceae bacterium]
MRHILSVFGLVLFLCASMDLRVWAQSTSEQAPRIEWEVKNRFRLFRNEADFERHVAAYRGDSIVAAEGRLADGSRGRGWARETVRNLCLDAAGRLTETCVRDGARESYLSPTDHRVTAVLAHAPANATCSWSFVSGDLPIQRVTIPCDEEVTLRIPYGRATNAAVDISAGEQLVQQVTAEMSVRDVLIAGLGDSIAAGEGNPDRPIVLSDNGFCFRRFLGGTRSEYFRPARKGYRGDKSCEIRTEGAKLDNDWTRNSAGWMSAACHRSLYSYQLRTALALAVENTHVAVTYIPLACTGASIEAGLFASQRAREIPCSNAANCPSVIPDQISELRNAVGGARRKLDLLLLTVGANDIRFSELVAHVIIDSATERALFLRGGMIASVSDSEDILSGKLPANFNKLRTALKPLVGGDLSRVLFVSYANPALHEGGIICPEGRDGFDIHPAFSVDTNRLRQVSDFVSDKFLPRLKDIALCENGVICSDLASDRMSFVDTHQRAFADHGFCAHSASDPQFDRECFSREGDSFQKNLAEGADHPLICDRSVSEFRAYTARQRWVRTANDSYFAAMTYPVGLPSVLQPRDIHDATWGTASAVYGGAVHPTAEGHAAMADAALPVARTILDLDIPPARAPIAQQPLPPINSQ